MFERQICEIIDRVSRETAERVAGEIRRPEQPAFKLVYSEQEAAEFLGLTKLQLQRYRREGLINFVSYPVLPRFDDVLTDEPKAKRNGLYSYTLAALVQFAEDHENLRQPRRKRFDLEILTERKQ